MIAKTSVLVATLLFVAGAQAQCGNAGVGVGAEQLCSFSGKNVICGELFGFITKPGSWDQAAVKHDLSILPGDLCGDYQGTPGFGPAHTTCSGNTVVRITPPQRGRIHSLRLREHRHRQYLFCRSYLLLLLPELDMLFREAATDYRIVYFKFVSQYNDVFCSSR
ncbi:hypothetical protein B0H14DRAFT_1178211 [Mycena olivaceomarginata]|nr:hypothetical protein B0H14DRAFT_1178211 [Mycena olivaceomarginata]